MNLHWHAPSPPTVNSTDVQIDAAAAFSPWTQQLALPPAVQTTSVTPADLRLGTVRAITIPITPTTVKVRNFFFPTPLDVPTLPTAAPTLKPSEPVALAEPSDPAAASSHHTRIKPPSDVIRLADRLQYVLQPSLECLLAEGSLSFPFHPFPYQFDGVAFLFPRQAAVLADEMGLGKTMQAITAVRLLLRRGLANNILLVCPKPLVTNWQREFATWAPEVPVMVIEGDQAKRHWKWQLPDVPMRIANYELLLRDREPLLNQQFDLVVLDESQRIKNRSNSTSEIIRSISRKRSWALTGTPVENSVEDLLGIFEFVAPGFLSPEMKPRAIGRSISDYVLRRTKDQVLKDLPPKMIHDETLELSPEQRESYRMAEDDGVVRLTEMGHSATIQHVFELVLRLKQICNFDPATGASSKLERLEADLEEIADSGRKAIIFSQWVHTLTRLSKHLNRFGPLEYHGKIPSSRRDGVIQQFRHDPSRHVLLMSYGAGGVGLNLQFVNYVFLFDRWWNPAVEDQAINRAHRIGVDGPVSVSRFLMVETIEERIDRVLQEKRELFDTIFSGTEGRRKLGLTQDEIFGLFKLKCPTGPIELAA